jgi:hypothetical protein
LERGSPSSLNRWSFNLADVRGDAQAEGALRPHCVFLAPETDWLAPGFARWAICTCNPCTTPTALPSPTAAQRVTFKWKDYRIEGRDRYKQMTLATDEFIRRFLIHVLPKGLHRIRHYGLFDRGACAVNTARARGRILSALRHDE